MLPSSNAQTEFGSFGINAVHPILHGIYALSTFFAAVAARPAVPAEGKILIGISCLIFRAVNQLVVFIENLGIAGLARGIILFEIQALVNIAVALADNLGRTELHLALRLVADVDCLFNRTALAEAAGRYQAISAGLQVFHIIAVWYKAEIFITVIVPFFSARAASSAQQPYYPC